MALLRGEPWNLMARLHDEINRRFKSFIPVAAAAMAIAISSTAFAQERVVPDTFLAVTTHMKPADVELKADVIRWSSADERKAVIDALESQDPAGALRELPTMGVVWRSNSAVGNSIKYADRTDIPGAGERITLVTDKPLGATSFNPWMADAPATDASLDYAVIELNVRQTDDGQGTFSLSAEVRVDPESGLVSLDPGDAAPLLKNVRAAPKPYWATED